jgi:hypothetical protein
MRISQLAVAIFLLPLAAWASPVTSIVTSCTGPDGTVISTDSGCSIPGTGGYYTGAVSASSSVSYALATNPADYSVFRAYQRGYAQPQDASTPDRPHLQRAGHNALCRGGSEKREEKNDEFSQGHRRALPLLRSSMSEARIK